MPHGLLLFRGDNKVRVSSMVFFFLFFVLFCFVFCFVLFFLASKCGSL